MRRSHLTTLTAVLLSASALAGCGSTDSTPGSAAATVTDGTNGAGRGDGMPDAGASSEDAAPDSPSGPSNSAAWGQCADATLARLSPEQRVGQVLLPSISTATEASAIGSSAEVKAMSSTLSGGYILLGKTTRPASELQALNAAVVQRLTALSGGVQPWVAADHEGGNIQAMKGQGFTKLPTAKDQLAWGSELGARAQSWGQELHDAGITLNFAPVADVLSAELGTKNQPIGRWERQYGTTPAATSRNVVSVMNGLQAAGVAATLKHFPGLGQVVGNTDFTDNVQDTVTTADSALLDPFRAGIDAGVSAVMMSTATYTQIDPANPAAFSPTAISIVRDDMKFNGMIVSDDLGQAKQVASVPMGDRALKFIRAGGDLAIAVGDPGNVTAMARQLNAAYKTSAEDRAQIDRAATHVLAAKARFGLVTCN